MTDDGDGDSRRARLTRLHDHLAATATRPVARAPSLFLGEAEAVAADLRDVDDPAVIRRRAAHVRDLLARVDSTGDPVADDHVAAARTLVATLVDD